MEKALHSWVEDKSDFYGQGDFYVLLISSECWFFKLFHFIFNFIFIRSTKIIHAYTEVYKLKNINNLFPL